MRLLTAHAGCAGEMDLSALEEELMVSEESIGEKLRELHERYKSKMEEIINPSDILGRLEDAWDDFTENFKDIAENHGIDLDDAMEKVESAAEEMAGIDSGTHKITEEENLEDKNAIMKGLAQANNYIMEKVEQYYRGVMEELGLDHPVALMFFLWLLQQLILKLVALIFGTQTVPLLFVIFFAWVLGPYVEEIAKKVAVEKGYSKTFVVLFSLYEAFWNRSRQFGLGPGLVVSVPVTLMHFATVYIQKYAKDKVDSDKVPVWATKMGINVHMIYNIFVTPIIGGILLAMGYEMQ